MWPGKRFTAIAVNFRTVRREGGAPNRNQEQLVEVVILHEHVLEHAVEQFTRVMAPLAAEEVVEVLKLVRHDRVHERVAEPMVLIRVPQNREGDNGGGDYSFVRQERVHERVVERMVLIRAPQNKAKKRCAMGARPRTCRGADGVDPCAAEQARRQWWRRYSFVRQEGVHERVAEPMVLIRVPQKREGDNGGGDTALCDRSASTNVSWSRRC